MTFRIILSGSRVTVGEYDNFDKVLRKFKKKVLSSNLINELQSRQFYIKPTTKRKMKKAAARKRWERYLNNSKLPPKLY